MPGNPALILFVDIIHYNKQELLCNEINGRSMGNGKKNFMRDYFYPSIPKLSLHGRECDYGTNELTKLAPFYSEKFYVCNNGIRTIDLSN